MGFGYRGLILAMACSAGCKQLLGIEEPIVADATVTHAVTGNYRLRAGGNNAMSEPQITKRIPSPTEITMTVQLADGTMPPVDYQADGTFRFVRSGPDQLYRLTLVRSWGTTEYQHTAAHLELADFVPGRLDVTPVTRPTRIEILASSPSISSSAAAFSTGVWGYAQLNASSPYVADWSTAVGTAPFGLLDETRNDVLYAATYSLATMGGVLVLDGLLDFAVKMSDGQSISLSAGPFGPVEQKECVNVRAARSLAETGARAAMPRFTVSSDWRLVSSVPFDHPFAPQLLLAYDYSPGSISEIDRGVTYGTPFPGMRDLAGIAVLGYRDVSLEGRSLRLYATGTTTQPLARGPDCDDVDLMWRVAMASVPTLAGTALTTDDLVIALRDVDPEVEWTLAHDGDLDVSVVAVFEIQPSGELAERARIHTVTNRAVLARSLFVPGRDYLIGVQTVAGWPNARAGDFEITSYPMGYMTTMSSPFRVAE